MHADAVTGLDFRQFQAGTKHPNIPDVLRGVRQPQKREQHCLRNSQLRAAIQVFRVVLVGPLLLLRPAHNCGQVGRATSCHTRGPWGMPLKCLLKKHGDVTQPLWRLQKGDKRENGIIISILPTISFLRLARVNRDEWTLTWDLSGTSLSPSLSHHSPSIPLQLRRAEDGVIGERWR